MLTEHFSDSYTSQQDHAKFFISTERHKKRMCIVSKVPFQDQQNFRLHSHAIYKNIVLATFFLQKKPHKTILIPHCKQKRA